MTGAMLPRELEQLGVAGRIVTPVRDVWRKARMLEAADPGVTLGLDGLLPASADEVMRGLVRLGGADTPAESRRTDERSWVDPSRVIEQAEAAGERLRSACERGERVLFGTGHPAGPVELYVALAEELGARGAEVLRFAEGEPFELGEVRGRAQIRYVGGVACLSGGGGLLHTHSPRPMEYLLGVGPTPDLVVGDHGFAGAGLAAGAEAVAIVDTNDPALILAWARGLGIWPILCDDNRPPAAYEPLLRILVARL